MGKRFIRSTGPFLDCVKRRVPHVGLTKVTSTFSYVEWNLLSAYWIEVPRKEDFDQVKPLSVDTVPLYVKFKSIYDEYRDNTPDRYNKLSGDIDRQGRRGGFTCRREHGLVCYHFIVKEVQAFLEANPPQG